MKDHLAAYAAQLYQNLGQAYAKRKQAAEEVEAIEAELAALAKAHNFVSSFEKTKQTFDGNGTA